MRTVEIGPEALGRGSLILVTPEHPLTSEPKPEELVLAAAGNSEIQMNQTAAALFGHLLRRVQSGNRILAASGYRTYDEQKRIWEETLKKDGLEFTKKYVAKPGHSEHQTGLAVDLAENQGEIDPVCPAFPRSGICQKFRQLAPLFGYIERYLPGKETVTGIGAEPWHFRYVGFPHSVLITEKNMVLEEYMEYLREKTRNGHPLVFPNGRQQIEIFYIEPEQDGYAHAKLPENAPYLVSGTNTGGLVVSLWRNSHDE